MKKTAFIILFSLIGLGYFVFAQSVRENTTKCVSIYRDYEMLCLTINRQHSPYPSSFRYHISAEMKNDYLLKISERREHFYQIYTLPLRNIVSFYKKTDTVYNEALFVLKMKDSILVETSDVKNKTKYIKQPQVSFTLENDYLIAQTEALLNNICRDNHRRKMLEEAKKLETTY